MRLLRKILIILIMASAFTSINAEPLEFVYEHYSSADGLPHKSICDIHQDRRGYLWLCTWYGLSRYDGNGFVNYVMSPGDRSNLSHNRILSVEEDASGYLWVMSYDYRLYRFDVSREEFLAIPSGLKGFPYADAKLDRMLCAENGDVWAAFADMGLVRISQDLGYEIYFNRNVGKNISGLHTDSEGRIYAVSEMGIVEINGDRISLLSRNSSVHSFAEASGKLYFADAEQLLVVDKMTREQTRVNLKAAGASEATSMSLTGTDSQSLYIGFRDNAIAEVDLVTSELRLHRNSMGRVRYLFPDSQGGRLWIATERTGIWAYDSSKDKFKHYEHSNNVMSYYMDTLARVQTKGDRTWVKMNNWGFGYYDRCCDEIIPLSNVKEQEGHRFMNGVACFEVDDSGVLWMSTSSRGLERVTVITPKVKVLDPPTRKPENPASSEVRAMLRDSRGQLWTATKSRELYRYSPDLASCRRFPDRQSGDIGVIYSIFEDSRGNIWLGTKGDGLVRMTPQGDGYRWKQFRNDPSDGNSLSSNDIYSVAEDKDGRIWVGTYGGGLSMLPDSDSDRFITVENNFPNYPLEAGSRVRYLHCMPDGTMLVATVSGLIIFEPSDSPELTVFNLVTKHPGDMTSLGNNDVMHIFTDRKGNTYLSTFGGGLNRLYFDDSEPKFEIISTDNGLATNIILSAADDGDGVIWIATESGLSSYNPQTSAVRNYTKYDGVPQTSFSEAASTSMSDGSVMFGTYDDICHIVPEKFGNVPKDSRLTISGLSIDGTRTPFSGDIVIPHDCSYFRIDFASLDFSSSDNSSFSYMLEGYDTKWISGSGINRAIYSRVPPGNYVFKVTETYPDDNEPAETIAVKVNVRSSLWNSVPAKIIYVLLGLCLLALLVKMLLTSMKLRNDIKLEQGLNEMKARFFTNVSHELRTPLTLILGGIDEIGRRVPPEETSQEYSVNMVRKNAKRMLTLVNQLLDTRSISDGRMKLKVSCFDVVRLVQNVYDDFKDMAVERQMELRIIKSVDSLMVWGDSMRLEALVYNILSNAFKYTSDGGKIEVGVLWREGLEEYRIMVKDNGIGVPKDSRKSIFEPFTRGSVSAFRNMASSGIGLSFCKEITEMHGGEIWVEDGEKGGSKFFVRLPVGSERFTEENAEFIGTEPDVQMASQYGLSKYKLDVQPSVDALKVLIVEDNAELKIYIYNSLVGKYDVRDAANGREALQLIEEGWMPDMIVTDLMMPEMDGIELINHIRNDFSTSHIPIIMITAKHADDTHLKAMKYGADGYIAKPFTMELLLVKIDNLLERRKALASRLSSQEVRKGRIEISPEEIVITDRDEQLIKKVLAWLEENVADADVTVDQLAMYVGMGRTSMYNKIKGLTGKSPVELIQEFRMEKATYYLKSGQFSVSETSYKVGFSDPGYFSRSFKKHFGISPADYIKQNKS